MKKFIRGIRGFTGIESVIIIMVITFLAAATVSTGVAVKGTHDDIKCKSNLREIYKAIQMYKNRFGQFPDRGGDLFLAKLYYTKYLVKYEAFICPADAKKDKAAFTDKTAKKCYAYEKGKYYETDDGKKIPYNWEKEEEWKGSWQKSRTFKPTEISYAARWNLSEWEKEDPPDDWDEDYEVISVGGDPTIIVCDDMEDAKGEDAKGMIHGDHINALFSDGSIKAIKATKMGEGILEAMKN